MKKALLLLSLLLIIPIIAWAGQNIIGNLSVSGYSSLDNGNWTSDGLGHVTAKSYVGDGYGLTNLNVNWSAASFISPTAINWPAAAGSSPSYVWTNTGNGANWQALPPGGVTSVSASNTSAIVTPTTGAVGISTNWADFTWAKATGQNWQDVDLLSGNQTIAGAKTFSQTITGSVSGNAGTVTNGVYLNGGYGSGFMKWNGASQPTQDTTTYQPTLRLVAGTYSDGKMCTYTASGTLLNCNTAIPTTESYIIAASTVSERNNAGGL